MRRKPSTPPTINVTPFVDVMLVLLVVFMVCSPMMQHNTEVSLPKTTSGKKKENASILAISINKKGDVFLDKKKISADSLVQKLTFIYQKNPAVQCALYADATLPYQSILTILTLINKSGVSNVSLVSQNVTKR